MRKYLQELKGLLMTQTLVFCTSDQLAFFTPRRLPLWFPYSFHYRGC